jgi:hypothetical protein
MRGPNLDLKTAIIDRMAAQSPSGVWTAVDFLDLGPREAVDQALHRLAASKDVRRIARGLYDLPQENKLTGKPTVANYRAVIDAIGRRDQARMVVDGITAANDLGLTDAVPARVVVFADARLRPIKLGNLTIEFKHAAPSRLYWAGRPAMRVVQALYWLRDLLAANRDRTMLLKRLTAILNDPDHGAAIRDDLRDGLPALPEWMQAIVRELLARHDRQDDHPVHDGEHRDRGGGDRHRHAAADDDDGNGSDDRAKTQNDDSDDKQHDRPAVRKRRRVRR